MKAPIEGQNAKFIVDQLLAKARGEASTLLKSTSKLPPNRLDEMKQNIKNYLQKDEVTEEDLLNLAKMESKVSLEISQNFLSKSINFYYKR